MESLFDPDLWSDLFDLSKIKIDHRKFDGASSEDNVLVVFSFLLRGSGSLARPDMLILFAVLMVLI